MGYRSDFVLSLGKTAAQITADFAGVPGLGAAVELLCGIIELCENVSSNRHAAIQLRDRCHTLLLAFNDSKTKMPTAKMNEAMYSINDCLVDIQTRMDGWAKVSQIRGFTSQKQIKHDIEYCHGLISSCLSKFDLVSHMEIHEWQHDFAINHKHDHEEIMEYLAEIQNSQKIASSAVAEDKATLRQMMSMMQQLLSENAETRTRTSAGLSNNLYDIQARSKELLPDMNLKSGEVQRIGFHPVSGSAAMDIYEGLYLGREKVAIKIIRAVNSNEQSLRRFKREVKIWSDIWAKDGGEHILPFYGFCQNDGPYPYMVSPWQKNGTLLNYVKRNDNEVDYIRLIRGIAEGIQVLHGLTPPVVHGDIKANNIVIDSYGRPLIADFGLSQIVEDITGIPFTQSRGVSDSYRWFAPEVCVGQGVLSVASDIYAFGMTTLEVLTHKQPFSNIKHTTEVVIRSARGERPPRPVDARVIERGLDESLWRLMNQCWALDPQSRPVISEVLLWLP